MKISEIFYSIQGEGSLVGVPSLFIRTSGCNLRCTWCDTPYTSWSPEGENLTIDEIAAARDQHGARHVVITGGEPMIAPDVVQLTEKLHAMHLHLTIETAGTVYAPVICDLMSISPKLRHSVPWTREEGRWAAQHERLRYQPEILRRLMAEYNFQLKFVVASPEDLPEIKDMCAELQADPAQVILMPEGRQREAVRERSLWLAEVCKAEGFRLSPRLHVDLWGDLRGV